VENIGTAKNTVTKSDRCGTGKLKQMDMLALKLGQTLQKDIMSP
jgi:hypothetical protein